MGVLGQAPGWAESQRVRPASGMRRKELDQETFAKPVRTNIMDLLGTHLDEESGPRQWANHELFEVVRPSFYKSIPPVNWWYVVPP